MRLVLIIVICLVMVLAITGTALATWPTGAQGVQYNAVNIAMEGAVAGAGIAPETFIGIYNSAVAGDMSGYSESKKDAACQVLSALSSYQSVLGDYNAVYNGLNCSTRIASSGPSRNALPSTGVAIALLAGSGVIGIGAATQLLRKSRQN
ncbi:MAG: hypothetical protein ACYCXF_01805 [Thermoleophilia bacterium]